MKNDHAELEAAVVALLDAGDPSMAATVALRGLGPEILGYLAVIMRDHDAAQDAFSEFAFNLWQHLEGFRRECKLRTWAYTVAYRAALRRLRDPYRKRAQPLEPSQISLIADEVRQSTASYLKTTMKSRVARLREKLKPDEQTLLTLRIDRKLEWSDVARVLADEGEEVLDDKAIAKREAALRKRFERLKEKLRKLAAEEALR